MLDVFRGALETDEQAKKRINASLQGIFRGFVERANHLELTADQAPTEATERDLRKLAADHRETANVVRAALAARGSSAPSSVGAVEPASGLSHWARIVEDLEGFHTGRNEIMELANKVLESYPELTEVFDSLSQRMSDHITRLRGEIARADPQALN